MEGWGINLLWRDIVRPAILVGKYRLYPRIPCIQAWGVCQDSIIAMLHAFMPTDNFEDAVLTAINFGGDSDTIGAITGGLAGCYYGYDNIPTRFIEAISSDIKKMLDTIIEAIPN